MAKEGFAQQIIMVIFVVEGNRDIGMGHVMRCLAIADAIKAEGEACLFVMSSRDCEGIVKKHGHEVKVVDSPYKEPKAEDIDSIIDSMEVSALFVDSYYVKNEYLNNVHTICKRKGCKLVYIDDRCGLPYSCDILLNYNIFSNLDAYKHLYSKHEVPTLLLGTAYAPLRQEFRQIEENLLKSEAANVFVSTGGADTEHITLKLVEEAALKPNYRFHFVVGKMNPDREKIRAISRGYENIVLHENVSRMDKLMLACDAALSAAGSTLYELCAVGVPAITYVVADNQIPAAEEFDKRGIMRNCGDARRPENGTFARTLIEQVVRLAENYDERKLRSEKMKSIVDGEGTKRIIERVLC